MPHFRQGSPSLQIVRGGGAGQLCGGGTGPGSCPLPSQPPSTLPREKWLYGLPASFQWAAQRSGCSAGGLVQLCNGRSQ